MLGEGIYFDLATLCDQVALPLDDVRAGAKARAEALRSGAGQIADDSRISRTFASTNVAVKSTEMAP
jgi:hypothetical protein